MGGNAKRGPTALLCDSPHIRNRLGLPLMNRYRVNITCTLHNKRSCKLLAKRSNSLQPHLPALPCDIGWHQLCLVQKNVHASQRAFQVQMGTSGHLVQSKPAMKFDPIMVVSGDCPNVDEVAPLAVLDFQAGLHLETESRSPGLGIALLIWSKGDPQKCLEREAAEKT